MVEKMKFRRSKQTPERDRERLRPDVPSRSKRVYSYYASSAQSAEHPVAREPRVKAGEGVLHKLRLLPAIIALVVIIGSILYSFTLGSRPSVTTLQNQPSPYHDTEVYADAADELLRSHIRNRTKFTVQTPDVEQALLDRFPELQDAVLRLPVLGRTPTLVLEIRQPALLLSAANKTYVLDKNGIATREAKDLGAATKEGLPSVQDQSGLSVKLGQQVLTRETVQFVLDAVYLLREQSLTVESLTLPVSINELDIRLSGLPYFIKTDTSTDIRQQIGGFVATKEFLAEQGIVPSEYIDVRVEEKVFYK